MRSNLLRALALTASILAGCAPLTHAAELTVTATDQSQTPVEQLVVWLTPLDQPVPAAPAELSATIEQIDEEFVPYLSVVRVGTRVAFPNRDNVQHHVYSLSRPAKFEIPLHGGQTTESVVLDTPGLIPVGCNIHDWMISHIVVVDTPWFGQCDATGTLTLSDLPAGRYTLNAWHPRLRKAQEQEVTITAAAATRVALELRLRPDRRLRRAPDAGGHGY